MIVWNERCWGWCDGRGMLMMMMLMVMMMMMWWKRKFFLGRESDNCAISGSLSHQLSQNFSKKYLRKLLSNIFLLILFLLLLIIILLIILIIILISSILSCWWGRSPGGHDCLHGRDYLSRPWEKNQPLWRKIDFAKLTGFSFIFGQSDNLGCPSGKTNLNLQKHLVTMVALVAMMALVALMAAVSNWSTSASSSC